MQNEQHKTAPAELAWLNDYIPVSTRFDDPYYSKIDGRGETRHVFINGNALGKKANGPLVNYTLVIGELGFGTGLNFLETWNWLNEEKRAGNISATVKLRFFSFELYPMAANDMKTALDHWPELEALSQTLLDKWNAEGSSFDFSPAPDIELQVHFGDANTILPALNLQANAWYLDGFAPSKNPELWNKALLAEIYAKTNPGGSFATYTVAGWVRRNLQEAGFIVEKLPGFASKREMMAGHKAA